MSTATVYDSAFPRKEQSASSVEMLCRIMVEVGGGVFVGVCPAVPKRAEKLILFNSPKTRATLGCFVSELSAELVRSKIAASDAAFGLCEPEKFALPQVVSQNSRFVPGRDCLQSEEEKT